MVDFEENITFKYNLKNYIDIKLAQGNSYIKDKNVYWLIMILNDFKDDNDFIDKKMIYVPNVSIVNNLYDEFNNVTLD